MQSVGVSLRIQQARLNIEDFEFILRDLLRLQHTYRFTVDYEYYRTRG